MARPSEFSQEIADRICDELLEGRSLRSVCQDDGMPTERAVHKWLVSGKYPEFVQQYARAREGQADFYADQIIEIADTCEDPNKARIQVDARKWKASRMAPKKWGDRVMQEHTGAEGGPLVITWSNES